MSERRSAVLAVLLGIICLGAALRLYRIDHQSIWWDEAITLTVARAPLADMPRYFKSDSETPTPLFGWKGRPSQVWEFNPPVYFAALHAWCGLFGFGPLQARLMSATAGILSLPILFLIGVRLFENRTALTATLFLAVSQLGIMYSQEARNYALLLLLVLTTVYLFVVATSTHRVSAWVCCTISAVLMVGTHYYGALVIVALAIYAIVHWRSLSIPLTWIGGAALAGGASLLPWMAFALPGAVRAASPPEQYRVSVVRWSTMFSTLNEFNNGAVAGIVNTMPRWTFPVGALLFTGPVVFMASRLLSGTIDHVTSDERRATSLCALLSFTPVVLVLIFGLAGVKYDVRYVVFCIAPYYLLAAAGLCRLRSAVVKPLMIAAILCYSGYALRAIYYIPYKEDFRDAAKYVSQRAVENDCYAFIPFEAPPLGWMFFMSGPPTATEIFPDRNSPSLRQCQRTWVITYERGYDDGPLPVPWLNLLKDLRATHREIDYQQFFWIRVELYTSVDF